MFQRPDVFKLRLYRRINPHSPRLNDGDHLFLVELQMLGPKCAHSASPAGIYGARTVLESESRVRSHGWPRADVGPSSSDMDPSHLFHLPLSYKSNPCVACYRECCEMCDQIALFSTSCNQATVT